MSKNIVICSDGTGNSAIKGRGTNVFKLYEAVDRHGDPPQVAIYDDGVGTEDAKVPKLLGGAFGWGLSRNVKHLYTELARVYEPGDQIYMFGFSRGAFTVRTLVGLIHGVGIPDPSKVARESSSLESVVEQAYARYRERYQHVLRRGGEELKARRAAFRERYAWSVEGLGRHGEPLEPHQVPIRFVGVWDTVDAVGLPVKELADVLNALRRFKFPDQRLSPTVLRACHALAIDDERLTFHPLMWDERGEPPESDKIEQVWFAGVHSNVGGGYPRHGMSLAALDWMMTRAAEAGLRWLPSERDGVRRHSHVHDKLYDSRSGLGVYYRYGPRDIGAICRANHLDVKVHATAADRLVRGTEGYCPGNLPAEMNVVLTHDLQPIRISDANCAEPPKLARSAANLVGRYAHHALLAIVVLIVLWMALASDWVGARVIPALVGALALATAVPVAALHWRRRTFEAEARAAGTLLAWTTALALVAWLMPAAPTPWWDNSWEAGGWAILDNLQLPWPAFERPGLVVGPWIVFVGLGIGYPIARRFIPGWLALWLGCLGFAAGIAVLAFATTLPLGWAVLLCFATLLLAFQAIGRWSGASLNRQCAAAWPHDRRRAIGDRLRNVGGTDADA